MMKRNLPQNLDDLRTGNLSPKRFIKHHQVTKGLIKRLKFTKELVGHRGCVNCLEWNETGEFLASGSDDTHLMVWDPFRQTCQADIATGHRGNIFSVKFMPKSNNNRLASGAADFHVKLIDVSRELAIDDYKCHQGRVKRLAVCQSEPHLLWSCSEDGTVCQFDIREDYQKQNDSNARNVLVNLGACIGTSAEAKCLAINPVRSDQLAVGSNDPYVRLFDRRKLSLISHNSANLASRRNRSNQTVFRSPPGSSDADKFTSICVAPELGPDVAQLFVPGHVSYCTNGGNGTGTTAKYGGTQLSTTYLTFSPDGGSLLVNMGSEQIYLYDVNKASLSRPAFQYEVSSAAKRVAHTCSSNSNLLLDYRALGANSLMSSNNSGTRPDYSHLSRHLERLKDRGNKQYKAQMYLPAVQYYNLALARGGDNYARFFANRAAAYISRSWTGDVYAALHDSMCALELEPDHLKSHFRLAQCLNQLNMVAEAHDYVQYIRAAFPDQARSCKQISELDKEITDRISDCIVKNKERSSKSKLSTAAGSNGTSPNGVSSTPESVASGPMTDIPGMIASQLKTRRFTETRDYSGNTTELRWRRDASDYVHRYCGHCNTTTDIKEANFFGLDGQFIMAGSDDGNIFFWDRNTENILRVLHGDSNIVNCLQPHPTSCFLASSGIDSVLRLWSPGPLVPSDDGDVSSDDEPGHKQQKTTGYRRDIFEPTHESQIGEEQNKISVAQSNQERLTVDPFEVVLMSMGLNARLMTRDSEDEDDDGEDDEDDDEDEEGNGDVEEDEQGDNEYDDHADRRSEFLHSPDEQGNDNASSARSSGQRRRRARRNPQSSSSRQPRNNRNNTVNAEYCRAS